MSHLRARLATVLVALAPLLGPVASASADQVSNSATTPGTIEPVLTVDGWTANCVAGDGQTARYAAVLTDPPQRWKDVGIQPVAADMVQAWRGVAPEPVATRFDNCGTSPTALATRFFAKLVAYKASFEGRPGITAATKIDVVAQSYGTIVTRLCIKTVPGCAALIDDWVGVVPPSHGSTSPLFPVGRCYWLSYRFACEAADPGGPVQRASNSGDETPMGDTDPGGWIEYSTFRAGNDGVVYPAGSERLVGAANWRVTQPSGTLTTHGNVFGGGAQCTGSVTTYPLSTGIHESIAAELMDYTRHKDALLALPAPHSSDRNLSCANDPTGAP